MAVKEAELVGRPQVGEPWEGELSTAAAPGGGAIEEDVAEKVAVAGGRAWVAERDRPQAAWSTVGVAG